MALRASERSTSRQALQSAVALMESCAAGIVGACHKRALSDALSSAARHKHRRFMSQQTSKLRLPSCRRSHLNDKRTESSGAFNRHQARITHRDARSWRKRELQDGPSTNGSADLGAAGPEASRRAVRGRGRGNARGQQRGRHVREARRRGGAGGGSGRRGRASGRGGADVASMDDLNKSKLQLQF